MTTGKQRELRALMADYGLTYAEIAELASVSVKTAEGWLANPAAASFRDISRSHMDLIKLRLKGRRKADK